MNARGSSSVEYTGSCMGCDLVANSYIALKLFGCGRAWKILFPEVQLCWIIAFGLRHLGWQFIQGLWWLRCRASSVVGHLQRKGFYVLSGQGGRCHCSGRLRMNFGQVLWRELQAG